VETGHQDKDDQKWYNAWAGQWNQEWKEGQVIEIEFEETKYGNEIKTPQSAYKGGGQPSSSIMMELAEMKAMLEEIYKAVLNKKDKKEDVPF